MLSIPEGTWGVDRCGLGAERCLEASTGLRPRLWQPGLRLWDRAGDAAPAACGLPGRQRHGGDTSSLTDPQGLHPRVWGLPDLLTAGWCSSASKATPRGLSRGLTTEGRGPGRGGEPPPWACPLFLAQNRLGLSVGSCRGSRSAQGACSAWLSGSAHLPPTASQQPGQRKDHPHQHRRTAAGPQRLRPAVCHRGHLGSTSLDWSPCRTPHWAPAACWDRAEKTEVVSVLGGSRLAGEVDRQCKCHTN